MSMNHPISRTVSPTGVLSSLSLCQLFALIFTLGRLAASPEVLLFVEAFSTSTSSDHPHHHHPVVGNGDIRGRPFQLNINTFSKVVTISSHHHYASRSRGSVVALQSTDTNSIETEGNDNASASSSLAAAELSLKAMQSETPRLTSEDRSFVSFLYNNNKKANEDDQSSSLENAISDSLETMSPSLLVALQMAAKTGEWNEEGADGNTGDDDVTLNFAHQMVQVGTALQNVLDNRLVSGRALLTQLLNSGEIRKLDSLIGKAAKEGKLDMSFFSVLSMNMHDAAMEDSGSNNSNNNDDEANDTTSSSLEMEGDGGSSSSVAPGGSANRGQILQHIYTRCQEELEKNVPPGMGLLNKLLRTEISSIRTNQLQYYLGPQATSITSPDGKTIELNNGTGGKALVSHGEFIDALSQAVNQIRTLEKAGGTDRLSAMNLIENIRRVAMEARVVLVDCYGEGSEIVSEFQRDLQPVFRPTTTGSG